MNVPQLIDIMKDSLDVENVLIYQKLEIILIPKEGFNKDYSKIVLGDARDRFLEAFKEMTNVKNIEIKLAENAELEEKVLEENGFSNLSEGL